MIKKTVAALAVLGVWAAMPVVAHAAPAQNVTDVRLAWENGKVKISWTEQSSIPNEIYFFLGDEPYKGLGKTTAAEPNQLVVPASALEPTHDASVVANIVINPSANLTDQAWSKPFDRYIRGPAAVTGIVTSGNVLNWSANPDTSRDATPNDPLDVPGSVRYVPRVERNGCQVTTLASRTVPNGVVPNQGQPFNLKVATANEWGESPLGTFKLRTSSLTMTAPSSTTFGSSIGVTGTVSLRQIANCKNVDDPAKKALQISLQARDTATKPWYSVTVTRTNAQGKYSFSVPNPGAREYRTAVNSGTEYPSITGSKVIRTRSTLLSAKFVDNTIALGQQPNAFLWVDPARHQLAALQFKNANGVWQGIVPTQVNAAGWVYTGGFNFNLRGKYEFRWWVGGFKNGNNLTVDAFYTPTFPLTIS